MRVMIANDKQRLIARVDYDNVERTKLNADVSAGATTITVFNSTGFDATYFLCIGEPGSETAEIKEISLVSSNTITLSSAVSFDHKNKDRVYRLEYNQVRFYQGSELDWTDRYDSSIYGDAQYGLITGSTVDLRPDYYTYLEHTIEEDHSYCLQFYNSVAVKESPLGEKINGYEYLLCSIADLRKYEDVGVLGSKLIDKIDIATWEIIPIFSKQDQDYEDLVNRDILRQPACFLALYYCFIELTKNKDDINATKASRYKDLYKESMINAAQIINKTESSIMLWGQTRIIR